MWAPEEDARLIEIVHQTGVSNWNAIASRMIRRTAKQCRGRWSDHLRPGISKDPWTPDEDRVIIQNILEVGHSWVLIASKLPGRTDASVANRYHQTLHVRMVRESIRIKEFGSGPNLPESSRTNSQSSSSTQSIAPYTSPETSISHSRSSSDGRKFSESVLLRNLLESINTSAAVEHSCSSKEKLPSFQKLLRNVPKMEPTSRATSSTVRLSPLSNIPQRSLTLKMHLVIQKYRCQIATKFPGNLLECSRTQLLFSRHD